MQAGDFWKEKDYKEWSESECRKMLTDSPWATSYTLGSLHIEPLESARTDREREQTPIIQYRVQFLSSPMVRRAMVRLSQIQSGYDSLTAEQRQNFDRQAQQFLENVSPNAVILSLAYSVNITTWDRDLHQYWRGQTTELMKNKTFLISGEGHRIPLAQFAPPDGDTHEVTLAFLRTYEGEPVARPGDKRISLEFVHPAIGGQNETRALVQFPVKRMTSGGDIIY